MKYGHHIREFEREMNAHRPSFPQGAWLAYKPLKKQLKQVATLKANGVLEEAHVEALFEALCESVNLVVKSFRDEAMRVLSRPEKGRMQERLFCISNQRSLLEHGIISKQLRLFAVANAVGLRKFMKKIAKVCPDHDRFEHLSSALRSHAMQLHSPLIMELWAIETRAARVSAPENTVEFLDKMEEKLGDSGFDFGPIKRDIDLGLAPSCHICFEALHSPVGLACGHYFCKQCLLQVANLPPFCKVTEASHGTRCPQCREIGAFSQAVKLKQFNRLILDSEKKENRNARLLQSKQAKVEHQLRMLKRLSS
ncbi:hypothetical protein CYMTET_52581 [Cymbomonas tetramitiformis]|uniref:RING-type E3 ubiquitin transferase n=1 Tax=Cymbomonas tetramitiformis TaxID=36881 RepID=A0AAE0BK56_9CHLO|nr:hypothetical protein CYMTET_52581 [Cymbomonas tetramitiformis]